MEENQVHEQQATEVVETKEEEIKERTFTQSEVDAIIQKRLAKEQSKFEQRLNQLEESQKLSQMNESQKQEYEYNKRLEELTKREQELETKQQAYNQQTYKHEIEKNLTERGLPLSLADMLVTMDAESSLAKMNQLQQEMGASVNAQIESKIKQSAEVPVTPIEENKPITLNDIANGVKATHSELEKAILDALRK